MVKGKGAALLALALAGAAYWFRNKQQVKETINQMAERAGGAVQDLRETAKGQGDGR